MLLLLLFCFDYDDDDDDEPSCTTVIEDLNVGKDGMISIQSRSIQNRKCVIRSSLLVVVLVLSVVSSSSSYLLLLDYSCLVIKHEWLNVMKKIYKGLSGGMDIGNSWPFHMSIPGDPDVSSFSFDDCRIQMLLFFHLMIVGTVNPCDPCEEASI